MSTAASSAVREAVEFCLQFIEHPVQFALLQWEQHPYHIVIEIAFVAAFLYFYMIPLHKAKKLKVEPLTKKEEEMLLEEFHSEPLRTTQPDSNVIVKPHTAIEHLNVAARSGVKLSIVPAHGQKPVECLDLATFDYHSLSTHEEVRDVAKRAVAAYGVGSCGPRGFYGTVKPHLDLETNIAKFLGVDSAIIYSFSFATVSTLIPCYSSRGDYIVADEGISLPTQEGCHLSRANVAYYKHNDLFHLEELMAGVQNKDSKSKKISRRFVVTEGLFRNSGDLCHLPEIVSLCRKYKFRLILEDSYGFGAVGPTGRGTPEHFQIPTSLVDIYVGSMSTSLGTVGGFCAGEAGMIDHQRLAATGYVFSASLPPYMTTAASKSIEIIERQPQLVAALQKNAKTMRNEIRLSKLPSVVRMIDAADDVSPIIHLRPTDEFLASSGKPLVEEKFQRIVESLQHKKIIILRHLYTVEERVANVPSLRISVKSNATTADLVAAARSIVAAVRAEFSR